MKIKFNKTIAVLLTVSLLVVGSVMLIFANTEIDENINQASLGYSGSGVGSDFNRLELGASGGEITSVIAAPTEPVAVEVAPLGLSVSSFGTYATKHNGSDSIGNVNILPADISKVLIVPATNGVDNYQSFPGTVAGLANAVYELNQNGGGKDYVLYIGTDLNVPNLHELTREIPSVTAASQSASFTSLKGKVGTLVITASTADPITSSNTNPNADAKQLIFNGNVFFGSNIVLRNLRMYGGTYFMLGNSISLNGGFYFTSGAKIYGGSYSSDVEGSPTITINTTGNGAYEFYGGNQIGGTLTGNTEIIINNTSGNIYHAVGGALKGNVTGNTKVTINNTTGGIDYLFGGAREGTVTGDSTIVINNTGGNINNIYGGGYGTGTGATATANVGGNVSTTINNLGGTFNTYYGGVLYGNVGGSVTNVLDGKGATSTDAYYYGGSREGNIGGSLLPGSDAITNTFDSSAYTAGRMWFTGANYSSGVINGNINSKITAGEINKGSLNTVNGAGSDGTPVVMGNFIGKTKEEAQIIAKNTAKFSVYGNVHTEITKGFAAHGDGRGYIRGAGWGGYIEGNVTIEVGTEGLVANSYQNIANPDTTPSSTINNRGYFSAFDIVGGGGNPDAGNTIFIKGDTRNILHNVFARWTYGGSFSGSIWGNTYIELHKGVVDTLEGAGRNGQQTWGSSSASVYGGQVDWFLSGGGWNDEDIFGDVSVYVEKGTINASMGGTYGAGSRHTIHGNSIILVKGGDFSGKAREGNNGFAGGATNAGTIKGNSSVTIDLRGSTGFSLPGGTKISGGRPERVNTFLGTSTANTIELNIFTGSGSNVLNGASIYGDGGTSQSATQSGKITVNIDAPDSSIGTFYATEYSNIYSNKILRDVTINIENVDSINGMSGGSSGDNFTDAIVTASENKSTMNFNVNAVAGDTHKTFAVGDIGAVNFTSLNVNNATIKATGTGGIKNSSAATVANHGNSYYRFGDINLTNGSGLYIGTASTAMISANMLNISGKGTITSPAGTGKVVINGVNLGATDSLHWAKNGGTALASEYGTWFGKNLAYKAITFSPNPNNATQLTPYNFSGSDGTVQMLGDNEEVASNSYGHGITISGTRVDFKVVGGIGSISHNVDKVLQGTAPPLNGASSVGKDVSTQEGWLAVVASYSGAQLTFTPDASTGSWIKRIKIIGSDGSETNIPETTNSDPYIWNLSSADSSYTIEVTYTNESELSGRSVIITESEAAAITTAEDIMTYQEISGRPFFTSTIDQMLIDKIKAPLPTGIKIRSHSVTYSVGLTGGRLVKDFFIAVVPDTAVIELPSRRAAIDANDATMMLAAANTVTDSSLKTDHTNARAYLPNGTFGVAVTDGAAIGTLNAMAAPGSVNVTYSYTLADPSKTISKTVVVLVLPDGKLQLDTVPDLMFGGIDIPGVRTDFWLPVQTELVVEDSRINPYGSNWSITLKVIDLKTDVNISPVNIIPASAVKYTNTNPANGPVGVFPLDSATLVWKSTTIDLEDFQTLAWPISTVQGFSIELDPVTTKPGAYSSKATWSIVSGP